MTTATALPYEVEQKSPEALVVRTETDSWNGYERWFLLRSDAHHDNKLSNWELERKHLDQAVERNAGIFDFGDLFCAMQGKWDKRSDLRQCRPEHQQGRYLDALIETAAEFYAPYAHHFIMLTPGNHETEMLKKHETHLTERLVERLNTLTGASIHRGSYQGWVRLTAKRHQQYRTIRMAYHHGYGGGGAVTRGVIQTNRMAVYLPDANIVVTGHTHDSWLVAIGRDRISDADKCFRDTQYHVRCPGYKDEYGAREGWHIERGAPPKTLGAWWLRLYGEGHTLNYEFMEAK